MSNAKLAWALSWRENALFEEREKNNKNHRYAPHLFSKPRAMP